MFQEFRDEIRRLVVSNAGWVFSVMGLKPHSQKEGKIPKGKKVTYFSKVQRGWTRCDGKGSLMQVVGREERLGPTLEGNKSVRGKEFDGT